MTTTVHPSHVVPAPGGALRADRQARAGAALSGSLTAVLGAVGLALGLGVVFCDPRHLQIDWLLPLVGVRFDLDPLGGVFIAATGAVAIAVVTYAVGYANRERWARFPPGDTSALRRGQAPRSGGGVGDDLSPGLGADGGHVAGPWCSRNTAGPRSGPQGSSTGS